MFHKKFNTLSTAAAVGTLAILAGCNADDVGSSSQEGASAARFVYTTAQSADDTRVITHRVAENGLLAEVSSYSAGAIGGQSVSGVETDDILAVVGGYLIVLNSASHSVSVFSINETSGELTRVDQNEAVDGVQNIHSGGLNPVSVETFERGEKTWVLVANQGVLQVCVNQGQAQSVVGCEDQNGQLVGEPRSIVQDERNIRIYQLVEGMLVGGKTLQRFAPDIGALAEISVGPRAEQLAVVTTGIPNAQPDVSSGYVLPSQGMTYSIVNRADGFSLADAADLGFGQVAGTHLVRWGGNGSALFFANASLTSNTSHLDLVGVPLLDSESALRYVAMPAKGYVSAMAVSMDGDRVYAAENATGHVYQFAWSDNGFSPVNEPLVASGDVVKSMMLSGGDQTIFMLTNGQNWQLTSVGVSGDDLSVTGSVALPDSAGTGFRGLAVYPSR
ncbi:Uncharacterised protein [BD1-7 clade bacterium]|uniref:6-phosphogluconolactonase n=1 Tax=BD1-7 clade bacterium TaxID=2029982 RepID=A0A5S9QK47_9GAMM|nr:Uncharacterised protein [BD1-7 clade bacterium]